MCAKLYFMPENSCLLGFKPSTLWYRCRTRKNQHFFIVTTAGKEKPTMWQDLKTMIIILERHLSPSQSHSQMLIPPAWHCWQSDSRSYSEAMNLIPTKSGMYSFASPNIIAAFTKDNARQGLWNISSTRIYHFRINSDRSARASEYSAKLQPQKGQNYDLQLIYRGHRT